MAPVLLDSRLRGKDDDAKAPAAAVSMDSSLTGKDEWLCVAAGPAP